MRFLRILSQRWRSLFRRPAAETQLENEIELHLDQLTKEYLAAGLSEAEARRAALRAFGSMELAKEQCRDTRRVHLFEDLGKDLLYAWRLAAKSPGFTLTAVLSLMLGIGANTVVFSALNALIFNPLSLPAADRLFFVNNSGGPSNSFPNYRDIRDRNAVFEQLFAYRLAQVGLTEAKGASRLWGYLVTGNYFQALGLKPAVGRLLAPEDDTKVNGNPYIVLSHACWQSRFAADPAIAGRQIRINGLPYTVLGVAPPGFRGTEVFIPAEIWIPMSMQPQIEGNSWLERRHTSNSWIAGILKPGVTVGQAEENLKAVSAQMGREHRVNETMRLTLSPPGLMGSTLREPARAFGLGVQLLAVLVLLAACTNLAALLTARGAERERDMAIRVSLGAGTARLIRQILTESVALAITGGFAALALATLLLHWIGRWKAPLDFPVQFDVAPDWNVFGFSVAISLATGILFGIGPAVRAASAGAGLAMKGAAPRSAGRWMWRDSLLPVQIALCCLLVTASLVAVRGLARSLQIPLGFSADGVAVAGLDLNLGGYKPEARRAFLERAVEETARLPGVSAAAFANSVPLSLDQSTTRIYRSGETDFENRNGIAATYYYVSSGYLETTRTPLLSGRAFTGADDSGQPRVAIVNAALARRLTGTADAVGRQFRWDSRDAVEIVGVVQDGKYETLTEAPRSVVFLPAGKVHSPSNVLLARSNRPAHEVAAEMRQVLLRLDPDLAAYGVGSLRQMLGMAYLPMQAAVIALGAFGVLALMLAITGIYGVAAHTVARRRKEIGIRMAIGARPVQVLRFVFGRLGAFVSIGALAGLAGGVAVSGLLAAIVYQATPHDPVVILGSVAAISVVALSAALGPALRAVKIDPIRSLRQD